MASITDQTPVRRITALSSASLGADSTDPGPSSAQNPDIDLCAQKTAMVTENNPPSGLLGLTQLQVKALLLQISFALTNGGYSFVDTYNRVGKYLLPSRILASNGYLKQDYFELYGDEGTSAAVQIPAAWSGKDNISNLTDFLAARDLQENLMFFNISELYADLVRNNSIRSGDKPATIMGMLFVAHVSNAEQARVWRTTGVGKSREDVPLGDYYSLGKYAATVLAAPTGII